MSNKTTNPEAQRSDLDRQLEAAMHDVQMEILSIPNKFNQALLLAYWQGLASGCQDDQDMLDTAKFFLGDE